MNGVRFTPIDTWCFGDGVPFAGGSATQDSWGGVFPPHPPTVIGALRVALARANGWDGRGRWGGGIAAILGDGPVPGGALGLRGPFLLRGEEPLFPMPHHVLGSKADRGTWEPVGLSAPGPLAASDLGERRLPRLPDSDLPVTPATGSWLTPDGLVRVLGGGLPEAEEVIREEDLWLVEERIGIARDSETRTAQEGALFGVRHVRLADGVGVGIAFEDLPEGWELPRDTLVPLGGEGRLARLDPWQPQLPHIAPSRQTSGHMIAILLTPARLDRSVLLGDAPVPGLHDAEVISAVIDGVTRFGGWDSGVRRPLPLRSYVPAGSVLFLAVAQHGLVDEPSLVTLGNETHYGFGLAATGAWLDEVNAQEAE